MENKDFDDILLRYYSTVDNKKTIYRRTKGCILPFSKKGDLGISNIYCGITLTSIAAKTYNAQLHNPIETKMEIIIR